MSCWDIGYLLIILLENWGFVHNYSLQKTVEKRRHDREQLSPAWMGSLTPLLDTAHSERSVTAPAFIMSKMQLRLLLNSRKKCSSHSVLFKECHVKKAMMSRTLRCILTNIHSHVASLNQSTYKLQKLFKEITFKCLFFFKIWTLFFGTGKRLSQESISHEVWGQQFRSPEYTEAW